MLKVILIAAVICIGLMAISFLKPSIKIGKNTVSIFWIVPFIGAMAMLLTDSVALNELTNQLISDSAVNPLKILLLFISMTLISVYLDCVGFFKFLAAKVLANAGKNQTLLFVYLYLTVSVLTVFTSNDIIVLTFTPFICYFAKNAEIEPIPYLIPQESRTHQGF